MRRQGHRVRTGTEAPVGDLRMGGGSEADLWWSVEGVRVQDGLNHDEGLG